MKRTAKSPGKTGDADLATMYAEAFHLIPGYAYLLDKDCILVDCNDNFLNLLGLDPSFEKTIGLLYRQMLERELWTENQISLIKTADIHAILSNDPPNNMLELPRMHGNGHVTWYQFSRMPLVDAAGEVHGLLVIVDDVTEMKQMAEQLEKIKAQLQTQNTYANTASKANVESKEKTPAPRVLVVEDNLLAQKAAKSILMNQDCLVELAGTESEFNNVFKPGKYDLVFMDIGLEGTSGYMMAKQLRLLEKDSDFHVPIIALTGFDADVVQFDCDYYQMEGVITKPLTAEQVKQIIQRYIFKINMDVTGLASTSKEQ